MARTDTQANFYALRNIVARPCVFSCRSILSHSDPLSGFIYQAHGSEA